MYCIYFYLSWIYSIFILGRIWNIEALCHVCRNVCAYLFFFFIKCQKIWKMLIYSLYAWSNTVNCIALTFVCLAFTHVMWGHKKSRLKATFAKTCCALLKVSWCFVIIKCDAFTSAPHSKLCIVYLENLVFQYKVST